MRRISGLTAALWLLAVGAAWGAAPRGIEAVSAPRHDLELGFTIEGAVAEVLVRPGDRVEAGQALIRLDDREGAAQIRSYELRAQSTIEVDAAEAALALAQNEAARIEEAMAQAGAAPFEVERARLEARVKGLGLDMARQRREETRLLLLQAQVAHERSLLKAPMAGIVEEVRIEAGELVESVRPVLRLVVTDPLTVDAPAPVGLAAGLRVGAPAWVRFKDTGTLVEGRVVFIASVADPGSETRIVRIEAPNPRGEPAGAHVTVSFEPVSAAAGVSE